ncbi:Uncharacterised protein [Bergeyella zoohelcum]|uniref:Uncharacterized protein n=2 Tax=Bergeyella zoohelcum TaxID=1015 RepID=K1LXR9_9FLAO|nr:hypothetical protein [Bergeyella zoohelcum]EKB56872.1 hypothetical protein HMPREF9699_01275 [Bergeyella zoohelcum ATCC 43767]SUV48545.1 Uncharacterised protein [Bergeyella zoohelcum]VDH05782.1 Uncharacterised protein [Bergeyella zoohelcum]
MSLFGYKPTKLGWFFIFTLLVSLINPIALGVVLGGWFGYAIFVFAKKCYNSSIYRKD